MLQKLTFSLLSWLLFCSSLTMAQKYPFPQQARYSNGILPSGIDHKHVQSVYDIWLAGYYEESGNQARIKFDEPENTVSEGIGYGMLIMVYMDNEKNNTRQKFNKLWNYYKSHSSNGLMHWKIQGFTNNTPGTGAHPGDLAGHTSGTVIPRPKHYVTRLSVGLSKKPMTPPVKSVRYITLTEQLIPVQKGLKTISRLFWDHWWLEEWLTPNSSPGSTKDIHACVHLAVPMTTITMSVSNCCRCCYLPAICPISQKCSQNLRQPLRSM